MRPGHRVLTRRDLACSAPRLSALSRNLPRSTASRGSQGPGRALRPRPPPVFRFVPRRPKRQNAQTPRPRVSSQATRSPRTTNSWARRREGEGYPRGRFAALRVSLVMSEPSCPKDPGAPRLLSRLCPHYTGEDAVSAAELGSEPRFLGRVRSECTSRPAQLTRIAHARSILGRAGHSQGVDSRAGPHGPASANTLFLSHLEQRRWAHDPHSLSAAPLRLASPPAMSPAPRPTRARSANEERRRCAGPGRCPHLARPLAPLCTPPKPGRGRGAGPAVRSEGPGAPGGQRQGPEHRRARNVRRARSRALNCRRPQTPLCPELRARRRRPC